MQNDLNQKKTILITGCGRGIGFETAKALALQSHTVYAGVRNLDHAESLHELANSYNNLIIIKLDITQERDASNSIKTILKKEKKIDVLINNAAHLLFGPIEMVSMKQAKHQFDVNFFGTLRMVQKVLPSMRKRKRGHIISIGSTSGVACSPMYGIYAASKFALEAMMFALAANVHPWNIDVSIIEPSATATDFSQQSVQFGSRLDEHLYLNYIKNSYSFLSAICKNGEDPSNIAKIILNAIEKKDSNLRYMATQKAEEIFKQQLSDPCGTDWKKSAENEKDWYLT